MINLDVVGANAHYEKRIRDAFGLVPSWFVRAARISHVEVSNREDVRDQIALFEHESRVLFVSPNIGDLLTKAIIHELSHGIDDISEEPHHFSSMDAWRRVHRNQPFFDIPKYRDEPLEYLADQIAKYWIWVDNRGFRKLRVTHPDETTFIEVCVLPVLYQMFGGNQ